MKKIAIIGASYLQMPLVLKSKELGLQTHCFAWEEGAVCKPNVDYFYPVSTLDKEKILSLCRRINIDAIVSIASDVAVPTVNFVASNLNLTGNSASDSEASTNKFSMRERFKLNNIPSPQFLRVNNSNSLTNDIELNFPLIVKPVDRSGSRGVQKVCVPSELSAAIHRARKESFIDECIVEEYIEGVEVSVESISWKGKHFVLAITDKLTTEEPYFVELEHHQPSQLSSNILEKIKTETLKALAALQLKYGASHAEFRISADGEVYVIEVGARMGGDFIGSHLVQLSTGYDFVKGVIDVSLGHFEEPILKKKKYSGVYFLCKETKHLVPVIQNADSYKEIVEAEITDTELHAIKCSADRSGYFIYQGESRFTL
jgi:biotin carboxylase